MLSPKSIYLIYRVQPKVHHWSVFLSAPTSFGEAFALVSSHGQFPWSNLYPTKNIFLSLGSSTSGHSFKKTSLWWLYQWEMSSKEQTMSFSLLLSEEIIFFICWCLEGPGETIWRKIFFYAVWSDSDKNIFLWHQVLSKEIGSLRKTEVMYVEKLVSDLKFRASQILLCCNLLISVLFLFSRNIMFFL